MTQRLDKAKQRVKAAEMELLSANNEYRHAYAEAMIGIGDKQDDIQELLRIYPDGRFPE